MPAPLEAPGPAPPEALQPTLAEAAATPLVPRPGVGQEPVPAPAPPEAPGPAPPEALQPTLAGAAATPLVPRPGVRQAPVLADSARAAGGPGSGPAGGSPAHAGGGRGYLLAPPRLRGLQGRHSARTSECRADGPPLSRAANLSGYARIGVRTLGAHTGFPTHT